MKPQDEHPAKKPYETPELFVYGDIRTITRNNKQQGRTDNPFTRTKT